MPSGISPYYEQQYRARTKDGQWKLILGHGRVTKRNQAGKPEHSRDYVAMGLQESAVQFHRHNIRKKLELVDKKINLQSFPQSLK
jgi:hypothetical protein